MLLKYTSICALFIASALILSNIPDSFAKEKKSDNPVSPSFKINHPPNRSDIDNNRNSKNMVDGKEFRTIDGSENNIQNNEMGAIFIQLQRILNPEYADGISSLAGENRPSAREISNIVNIQEELILNDLHATDYLWQWGQFLDHDISLTEGTDPVELSDIEVPIGDIYFDPEGTGNAVITFNRSIYDKSTGIDINNPREQLNEITSWIDASNVYGSDEERAIALRTNDGTGKLKTSDGNLLPFNVEGLPNAGGDSNTLFLSGDVRANEQVGLTALHTLFVREHNRLAEEIAEEKPEFIGDRIYEEARRFVGALMQTISFNEFLPALVGPGGISPYSGYNTNVNANIINSFSTAAYRFGHSSLSPTLLRLDSGNEVISEGNLPLRDAFFSPQRIIDEGGIEPLLRGLAKQYSQAVDPFVIDDVRNFLFGQPGEGGFDLASLNIQRGRDHGLPNYNEMREGLGLGRVNGFPDISSNTDIQNRLEEAYGSVDNIDLWVGGLSEGPLPDSHIGELFSTIIILQFEARRDGDRFWYELTLSGEELEEVRNTKLSDVIRRNTDIGDEIQDNVFFIGSTSGGGCTVAGPLSSRSSIANFLLPFVMLFGLIILRIINLILGTEGSGLAYWYYGLD